MCCSKYGCWFATSHQGPDRQPDHHQLQHGATVRGRVQVQQHRQDHHQGHPHQGYCQRHLHWCWRISPGVSTHQLKTENLPCWGYTGIICCTENYYWQKVRNECMKYFYYFKVLLVKYFYNFFNFSYAYKKLRFMKKNIIHNKFQLWRPY